MLHDLHNHTVFSYDGRETPEAIIENAIAAGLEAVGISDHQFSMEGYLDAYIDKINSCKEKYRGKIKVLCGLEIGTRPAPRIPLAGAGEKLDYCLFECIDSPNAMDFYEFLEWTRLFKCPKGLAHTDIFMLEERYGVDIFSVMKGYGLFWEINTSGNYDYYYDFITNKQKRERAAKSGIAMSVGSDVHCLYDFNVKKLCSAHKMIKQMGNPLIF